MNLKKKANKDFLTVDKIYYFFRKHVLGVEKDLLDESLLGDLNVNSVIFYSISWILIIYSLGKGIRTSGKIVYFTVAIPNLILIILLLHGEVNHYLL